MNIKYFYGPDQSIIRIENDYPQTTDGQVPFFGIIPRGLLISMESQGFGPEDWYQHAYHLFDQEIFINEIKFTSLQKLAQKCHVLSWIQSAKAVEVYLKDYVKNQSWTAEAWNIKEGHTSSVWRITLTSGSKKDVFALNVARDHEAGVELMKTMNQMISIQTVLPSFKVARVQDIRAVNHTALPGEVVVSRNEWLSGAFEIHQRRNVKTKENEYLMVERFLTNPDKPAQITSVLGHVFNTSETVNILTYKKKLTRLAKEILKESVDININDGDLVWCRNQAMLVALS